MAVVLLSDIGGTSARLQLVQTEPLSILKSGKYTTNDYPSIIALLEMFIAREPLPRVAVIGTEGFIIENRVRFVNAQWGEISGEEVGRALGIGSCVFLNDFVVAGYGCLELSSEDLIALNPDCCSLPQSPISVIGVGTGIGECFITWTGSEYTVWPSEGGNADCPAVSELHWKYIQHMQQLIDNGEFPQFNPIQGPSLEVCYGGLGAFQIYMMLKTLYPEEVDPEFDQNFIGEDRTRLMMEHGLHKRNKLSERAVSLWLQGIAIESGNLINKSLPYGGFYIIGGMVSKNAEEIANSEVFRNALLSRLEHVDDILHKVPIYIVKNLDVGLLGSLAYAKKLVKDQET